VIVESIDRAVPSSDCCANDGSIIGAAQSIDQLCILVDST